MRVPAATLLLLLANTVDADAVLFSNGPQINLPFGGAGGTHASQVQGDLGMTTLAFGGGSGGLGGRTSSTVYDDFVVPAPWSWSVSRITVFSMDQPFPAGSATVRLWSSAPWEPGATLVASGTATVGGIVAYRVPSDDPTVSYMPIREFGLGGDWTLPPGHYWLSWEMRFVSLSPKTQFQPQVSPITIAGETTTGNGRVSTQHCQFPSCDPVQWLDALDAGTGTQQGFPFVIQGRPVAMRKGDMGGPIGPDLLFRNVNALSADFGRNKVWFMNGVTRTSEAYITPDMAGPEWSIVGSDDFDTAGAPWNGPDGRADLLVRNAATGTLEFWLMNGADRVGASVPLTGVVAPDIGWNVAATADFDADGRPDIVWRHTLSQQLVVWTMNGAAYSTSILPTPDHALDANWTLIGAQDFNDDGATDFLWYNETSGRVVTWYLNAALQRTSGQFVTPPQAGDNNWRVVASGDYSRDEAVATPPLGSPDIVWRNTTSGRTVVWHLDFASTRTLGEFTSPMSNDPALDWVVAGPK